ncbi:hypothetical protein [Streptomyces sp. NPDC051572]|uniref:hypothetical protein n=1 Tax=Streptomyces sp. NPDC051572 TaxID=3155802 RepID=UPI00344F4C03
MNIDVTVQCTNSDKKKLGEVFGTDIDAEVIASIIARAGAREIMDQAMGIVTPSTIGDMRASRIRALLQEGLEMGQVEDVAAAMYRVPPSVARSMVRSTVARFEVIRDKVMKAVGVVLDAAEPVESEKWEVSLISTPVREWIMAEASVSNCSDSHSAKKGGLRWFPDDTYQHLRRKAGLAERPWA